MLSFDELVAYDPEDLARSIVTEEYRKSDVTGDANIRYNGLISQSLRSRDETYWSCPFFDTDRILHDLGFLVVLERFFTNTSLGTKKQETQRVYWHEDGLIATVSSYEGKNSAAAIYYNWVPGKGDWYDWAEFTATGSLHESAEHGHIWSGYHYMDHGVRHIIAKLKAHGEFLKTWEAGGLVSFLAGDEYQASEEDKNKIKRDVLAAFPPEIRRGLELEPW